MDGVGKKSHVSACCSDGGHRKKMLTFSILLLQTAHSTFIHILRVQSVVDIISCTTHTPFYLKYGTVVCARIISFPWNPRSSAVRSDLDLLQDCMIPEFQIVWSWTRKWRKTKGNIVLSSKHIIIRYVVSRVLSWDQKSYMHVFCVVVHTYVMHWYGVDQENWRDANQAKIYLYPVNFTDSGFLSKYIIHSKKISFAYHDHHQYASCSCSHFSYFSYTATYPFCFGSVNNSTNIAFKITDLGIKNVRELEHFYNLHSEKKKKIWIYIEIRKMH